MKKMFLDNYSSKPMKKLLLPLVTLFLVACQINNTAKEASPETVARKFYDAVFKGDIELVKKLFYIDPKWQDQKEEIYSSLSKELIEPVQEAYTYKGVSFSVPDYNDDKTKVSYKTVLITQNGEEKIDDTVLHKTAEGWKVEMR